MCAYFISVNLGLMYAYTYRYMYLYMYFQQTSTILDKQHLHSLIAEIAFCRYEYLTYNIMLNTNLCRLKYSNEVVFEYVYIRKARKVNGIGENEGEHEEEEDKEGGIIEYWKRSECFESEY